MLGSSSIITGTIAIFAVATLTAAAPAGTAKPQKKAQPPPYKPFNLFSLLDDASVRAEIERRHLEGGDLATRIERLTRGLVAAPYLLSPLGEGQAPDPDPRMRFDAFDCTTFVETAIALLYCDDPRAAKLFLDQIRYTDGDIDFQSRRHLMTSQWIPELTDRGLVRDVTRSIGGKKTKVIELSIDLKRWKKRRVARTLILDADVIPDGMFVLPYIPIADAEKLLEKIPAGVIVNVVRADVPGSPDVITHQGLIITRPGGKIRYVRHASPVSKRVIDEPLARMLWRYTKPRRWPIVGINLLAIVDPKLN